MEGGASRGRSLLRLLRQFFVAYWGWFAIGLAASLVTSLAAVSYGVLVKFVGDTLQDVVASQAGAESAAEPAMAGLGVLIGAILLAAIIRALSLYAMTLANNTGVQKALVDIQQAEFDSLTQGDFARLSGAASGGFVSRFINDLNAMRLAGLRLANNATRGVLTVLGALAAMVWMDWQLTLVLLVAYPVAIAPVVALGQRVRKRARHAQNQVGEVTSLLSEGFQSGRIIKAYGLEPYQQRRAARSFAERARLYLKVLADKAAVDPILEIAGGVAVAGVLGFSAWRISQGASTIGDFLGFIALIGVAAPEIRALGTLNAVAQEGAAAADRVFEIIEDRPALADPPGAQHLDRASGDIVFDEVGFHYPDGSAALSGLSFTVKPGETLALVGPSGAGKSTIFNLLLRLYETTTGRIRIDGHDIRGVTGESLRAQMALVAQDAALFDDTIAGNIALGRLGASREAVIEAAKAANAHEFIETLPGGYDSPAGEMGRNLSGGQRQRIALARAILRDAPILLLDEATSALDAESEAKVQAALSGFSKDRTVIVIAHRLSTVRAADRIIVIEDGRAVEQGDHDSLMARGGVYARLAELQLA
ncbi:MAG: ATP-binding cassette domain-containing protein [Alphaproteobacteria bacterium]|jgi:subfamily B ATP-binding cassette protein MsbA|nr:ATP-binding cassette domain-containing protein [Alphaproteobacteria bacterium]